MTITELRREYHRSICQRILGYKADSINNADKSNRASRTFAESIAKALNLPLCPEPPSGQGAGAEFEKITRDFLQDAFTKLLHVRPGNWQFLVGGEGAIQNFEQYAHLAHLSQAIEQHPELKAVLGRDYVITPDIVVSRRPLTDAEINQTGKIVTPDSATLTPLRSTNSPVKAILHASISCKWTIRSDRSQNTRTEALNLIRNRKGKTPHIVAVTAEPLPTRIASLALGTGDIDCVYHFALPELTQAAKDYPDNSHLELLETLITGRRLRDISDLPLDLVI